jgi:hypothetical protein
VCARARVCVTKAQKLISKIKNNYISKYNFEQFIHHGASCFGHSGSILLRLANTSNYPSCGGYLTPIDISESSLSLKVQELKT